VKKRVCDACYGALTGMLGGSVEILQTLDWNEDKDKDKILTRTT